MRILGSSRRPLRRLYGITSTLVLCGTLTGCTEDKEPKATDDGGADTGGPVAFVEDPRNTPAADSWPTYAGGPARRFFNPHEWMITKDNAHLLRLKWEVPTGAAITASPVIVAVDLPGEGTTKVVFFQSWDHTARAVRLEDGSEVWKVDLPWIQTSFPNAGSLHVEAVAGQMRVFVAAGQAVYSLNAITGAELWRFHAGLGCEIASNCEYGSRNEVISSPIVAGGLLLFGMDVNDSDAGRGGFYALDAETGNMKWFFDLTGATCRPNDDDEVKRFDGYHSEAELGLEAGFFASRAGCNDWEHANNGCGSVWSSPAVDLDNGRIFFGSSNCDVGGPVSRPAELPLYDEALVALNFDGTPVWSFRPHLDTANRLNEDLAFGATPNLFHIDVAGQLRGVVGIGNKDGAYYVVDRDGVNAENGTRWNSDDPLSLPYWSRHVVYGGDQGGVIAAASVEVAANRIVFSTAPGMNTFNRDTPSVHAVDMTTGDILWQNIDEGGNADSSFAPVSAIRGVAFVGTVPGSGIRVYDTATGQLLTRLPVVGNTASGAAIMDGMVVVGAGVGTMSGRDGDLSEIAAIAPRPLSAFCVEGTPACEAPEAGVNAAPTDAATD